MPFSRLVRCGVLCLTALLLSCAHIQESGQYAFTATELIRDECGLLATPEALWDGEVVVTGDVLRIDYQLFELQLRGLFREVEESFYADGSAANVLAELGGESCQLDLVTVRIEGTTDTPAAFDGTVRVDYQSRAQERCRCQLWASFRAEKTGN